MSRRSFSQPSLADAFVKAYSRGGGFLEEIAKTFEWSGFDVLLRGLHGALDGAPAYPPLTMFKIVLLQQWCGLSDPGAEEAVRDRLSFRRFCGVPLDEETPDHSSIWRFRQRIEKLGLFGEAVGRGQPAARRARADCQARHAGRRHDHLGGGQAAGL
jgi:transposase, IS5 family